MSDTDIANRALLRVGQSATITDLATDTSTAGGIINQFLDRAKRMVLMASEWAFATWTADLTLSEDAPLSGTEWPFSYVMPTSPLCLKPRRIVNGDRNETPGSAIPFRVMANVDIRATITGATAANPVVVTTSATHSFAANATIYISEVVGMTNINDLRFTVTAPTNTTLSLLGINGTAYSAYTSGGYVDGTASLLYTDQQDAQLEYTYFVRDIDLWPPLVADALEWGLAYMIAAGVTGGDPFGMGQKAYQGYVLALSIARASDLNTRRWDPPPESEFIRGR